MADLDQDIGAFEKMRTELEAHHNGKWVVIYDTKLVDTYDSFDTAADNAVMRFGGGPYLIRQVGAAEAVLPASVMYHLT